MSRRSLRFDLSGATMLEFALLLPLFSFLVVGITETGRIMWTQNALQHGAQMAARCATVNPGTCGNSAATQTFAAQQTFGLNPPASTFTVSTPACGNQVSANYPFTFDASLFADFFPNGALTLVASSCYPS